MRGTEGKWRKIKGNDLILHTREEEAGYGPVLAFLCTHFNPLFMPGPSKGCENLVRSHLLLSCTDLIAFLHLNKQFVGDGQGSSQEYFSVDGRRAQ